jgi:hypothetical protein
MILLIQSNHGGIKSRQIQIHKIFTKEEVIRLARHEGVNDFRPQLFCHYISMWKKDEAGNMAPWDIFVYIEKRQEPRLIIENLYASTEYISIKISPQLLTEIYDTVKVRYNRPQPPSP